MIKTCIEKRKKAIMVVPFISVAREKMLYFRDLLVPIGLRVDGFFGGYSPPGGFEKLDLAICTIEKANSIINRFIEKNKMTEIGILVIDEVNCS